MAKTIGKYDIAIATLKKLLDRRKMLRTEEIMAAMVKSNRSYDEIMKYINTDNDVEFVE